MSKLNELVEWLKKDLNHSPIEEAVVKCIYDKARSLLEEEAAQKPTDIELGPVYFQYSKADGEVVLCPENGPLDFEQVNGKSGELVFRPNGGK